ncbi:protein CMSS1-like isoform X2 [Dendronephthya gigantea]|nr:protein CMSS1-like isoform X2 [Dendronephthya gigantea]
MADDLGDEWWLNDEENDESFTPNGKKTFQKKTVDKLKKKKRHYSDETNAEKDPVAYENEENKQETRAKVRKRRRRGNKVETVEKTIDGLKAPEIFWSLFCNLTVSKLTALELEDLTVEDKMFFTDPSVHTGELHELSPYLNQILPSWSTLTSKIDKKSGAPGLLIITSAATRATDVVRAMADFRGTCKVVKLFSKHIKLEEQEEYLEKHVVHLGVGTPNRICKLMKSGALRLSNLKSVILDWTWRDAKQRRLMDIPEIQQDLVTLLKDIIL